MRILCNTQASPEEIQMMFANLKVREESFEKCMRAERGSTIPTQDASLSVQRAHPPLMEQQAQAAEH